MIARELIINALTHARIIGEGQTTITEAQLTTGFNLLSHIIRTGYHKNHIAFAKDRILVQIANGSAKVPEKYCHVTNAVFIGEYGHSIKLDKTDEDTMLQAMYRQEQHDIPPKGYTVDYDRQGLVTIQLSPRPHTGQLALTVYERANAPADLDEVIDIPAEWQTPLEYALAVLIAPEYGQTVAPEVKTMASQSWSDVSLMHGATGSISRG